MCGCLARGRVEVQCAVVPDGVGWRSAPAKFRQDGRIPDVERLQRVQSRRVQNVSILHLLHSAEGATAPLSRDGWLRIAHMARHSATRVFIALCAAAFCRWLLMRYLIVCPSGNGTCVSFRGIYLGKRF